MAVFIDTKHRSETPELMDDFSIKGELLRDTLDQLGRINKWLGGNRITLNGVKKILNGQDKAKTISIVDLGCGHGDMLRQIASFGRQKGYNLKLIGIDANADAISYANVLSKRYTEIEFLNMDIFSSEFQNMRFDVVLCTLFLHHFKENQLIVLLKQLKEQTRLGIIVNDLQRSEFAYGLFKLLGLLITNPMVKQDGLTSILRAFKKRELKEMSKQLKVSYDLSWKWAFRYQWIINTNKTK